jgi:hypothetical protein
MTTVPQQALFMMNSPFLIEQVRNILARPDVAAAATDAERVRLIFRALLQRAPRPEELKLAEQFLASESSEPATATNIRCQFLGRSSGRERQRRSAK